MILITRNCLFHFASDQRQQLNQITSHLDLSMVYGSTDEELALLRDSDASKYTTHTCPILVPLIEKGVRFVYKSSGSYSEKGRTTEKRVWF